MIVCHADQAVNERMFLSWPHTALAVVAFGRILARCARFRKVAMRPHGAATCARDGERTDAGLARLAFGVVPFVAAHQRIHRARAEISREGACSMSRACWLSPLQPSASSFWQHWPA